MSYIIQVWVRTTIVVISSSSSSQGLGLSGHLDNLKYTSTRPPAFGWQGRVNVILSPSPSLRMGKTGSYVYGSCLLYIWVMSPMHMSHVSHAYESCLPCIRVMFCCHGLTIKTRFPPFIVRYAGQSWVTWHISYIIYHMSCIICHISYRCGWNRGGEEENAIREIAV